MKKINEINKSFNYYQNKYGFLEIFFHRNVRIFAYPTITILQY